MKKDLARRIGLIVEIVNEATEPVGRTAMMKLLYFLFAVKKVDVGYQFTLYSYGPFDSNVLADMEYATEIEAVKSKKKWYSTGLGYELELGSKANLALKWDKAFVQSVRPSVKWAVESFGQMSAADLELASTIVFAERRFRLDSQKLSKSLLAMKVREIKPNFSEARILAQIESLRTKSVIGNLAAN